MSISDRGPQATTSRGGGAASASRPVVVLMSSDMMQSVRIADVVQASGGRAIVVDGGDVLDAIDRNHPVLILIDLSAAGDWAETIGRCKLRPHSRQIPIYAFGSHVDADTLRRARKAGADHAWARSRMTEELVQVVQRYVDPPPRYPDGWDGVLSEKARDGIEEFNRGDYYEQHELLEEAWMEEQRPIREMYQGILQVGLAFLQIERGSWTGTMKMFGRALPKLRGLPDVCQGVHVGALRRQAESIRDEVVRLGPDGLDEFDRSRFPKIALTSE